MRFVAPARDAVAPERFDHPIFAGYGRHRDLLTASGWPDIAALNDRMADSDADDAVRFATQDASLLADGLHYEQRIAQRGLVATRTSNWHDLLNALVWIEHMPIKRALNERQVEDIARVGPRVRTRGQYALTHFDEAGVIVHLRDEAWLDAWDAHDWSRLFLDGASHWREDATVTVFGHALLEHALWEGAWLVGKALVIVSDGPCRADVDRLAEAIRQGDTLVDPLELRPLPLSGIPGWHPEAGDPAFYRKAPCFRPVRSGRRYPLPFKPGVVRDVA